MSLEDRRKAPGRRITDRRSPPQNEAQRFASGENFTLFILRGIQSHIKGPRIAEFISAGVISSIYNICEGEIARIKHEQEMRKQSGGK